VRIAQALPWVGGYVDIARLHNLAPWERHLPVLEDLRAKGKIGRIGATHYSHRPALPGFSRSFIFAPDEPNRRRA
jgi:hypothetical protein